MTVPNFVPGLELSRSFYDGVVGPIVGDRPHAAALLGYGSDVMGFDTERSTDHGWGPRLQLLFADDHAPDDLDALRRALHAQLPEEHRGWPVRFGWDDTPVQHHVAVVTTGAFFEHWLGYDPRGGLDPLDWISTPEQLLIEMTRGGVFHDDIGEVTRVRSELAQYPSPVWLWMLACQWRRLDQEEPFVARTAEVGDDLGSRVLAARLARDVMLLCFRLEREYAPYPKWFGSAFARLESASEVGPALARALRADTFVEREAGLVDAYEAVARRHNALGVTDPVDPTARSFYGRPFRVLGAGRFVDACLAKVTDEQLRTRPLIGGVDQWSDNTDLRSTPAVFRRARALYGPRGG
jgi:Domain of unknown function (DUF4037)